jgi:hypothetical protein
MALLRHLLVTHPHGELAPFALDQIGVEAGRLLDERRRTGRARKVVSDLAVTNPNVRHRAFTQERG